VVIQQARRRDTVPDVNHRQRLHHAFAYCSEQRNERIIHQQQARIAVLEHENDLLRAQAAVDRVEDATHPPHAIESLQAAVGIAAKNCDALARRSAQALQRASELPDPRM